jgi:hypothetical protein
MNTIEVVLHINFRSKEKALNYISALQEEHKIIPKELYIEPYSKFKNQYRVSFTITSEATSDADRTFELLSLTQNLVPDFNKKVTIMGPMDSGQDLSFETIVNAEGVIQWANFQLGHA